MSKRETKSLRSILAATAFAVLTGPAMGLAQGSYAPMPCPDPLPWDGEVEGETYECGVVTVPENHDIPDGRQIELLFMRLHATTLAPASDPLVYLSGGPGGSALGEITTSSPLFKNMQSIRQRRDLVFYDQRGTGHSTLIACGPMSAALGIAAETMDIGDVTLEEMEAIREDEGGTALWFSACALGYAGEGLDLGQFNSISSARDIAMLTKALGYPGAYNLYGTSYGTRLSQIAMRETPERIRAVILDGTVSPAVPGTAETTNKLRYTYDSLFDLCAADAFCAETYPDLRDRFIALLGTLADEPLVFDPPLIPNVNLRKKFGVIDKIEPDFFATFALLNNSFTQGGYAPFFPVILTAMEARDTDLLRTVLGRGPVDEAVEVAQVPALDDIFDTDDAFFTEALEYLRAAEQAPRDEDAAGLATDWIDTVLAALTASLREGRPQAEVVGHLYRLALLPVHGPDAARLIDFANTHLPDDVAQTANALVGEMAETDLRLTMWSISDIARNMGPVVEGGHMSYAMLLGINCIEEVGFTPLDYVEELIATNPYPNVQLRSVQDYRLTQVICDYWPSPFAAEDILYPVVSDIPALVYTQGLDTQTPVKFGEDVAASLRNSFYHEWPIEGHVIAARSPDSCPGDIAAAFLDDPATAPNFACSNAPHYTTMAFELYHNEVFGADTTE